MSLHPMYSNKVWLGDIDDAQCINSMTPERQKTLLLSPNS